MPLVRCPHCNLVVPSVKMHEGFCQVLRAKKKTAFNKKHNNKIEILGNAWKKPQTKVHESSKKVDTPPVVPPAEEEKKEEPVIKEEPAPVINKNKSGKNKK